MDRWSAFLLSRHRQAGVAAEVVRKMSEPIDADQFARQAAGQGYLHRALVGFDQWVNVLTFGAPDDTISSRMQRWKDGTVPRPGGFKRAFGRFMCGWLGKIQKAHDLKANAGDWERAELEENRTERTLKSSGVEPPKEN